MPNRNRDIHILTEALGVVAGIYMILLYFNYFDINKKLLLVVGVTTLVVDSYFLYQWYKPKKKLRK